MNIEREVKNRMPTSWRFAWVGPHHNSKCFVAPTCYELDALYELCNDLADELATYRSEANVY